MLLFYKKQWKWWAPLGLLLILTPWTPWLDLHAARYFYQDGHFSQSSFLFFLYQHGEHFGFLVGTLAAIVFLLSYIYKKWGFYRQSALIMGLTLVFGAGLITNVLCKGYLGRPRPKQLEEFGGGLCYRPFWHPNLDPARSPQKSLPSGHVAMGFSYLALVVAGQRYRLYWVKHVGLFLTFFWGLGLMLARVAQGGHFFSDVILSACIMWWTAHAVDIILYRYPLYRHQPDKLPLRSTSDTVNADKIEQSIPKKE